MDEKIIEKLSQEDADKLRELRKQLDNGTLRPKNLQQEI